MHARNLAALAFSATLFACTSADEPSSTPPPEASGHAVAAASHSTPQAPPIEPGAKLPPTHPPIGSTKPLAFTVPEGWVQETPDVPMRREQYRLAKVGADTEDATVSVSVLAPRDGGRKEDNLARWAGQFEQPDGASSLDSMKQSTRKVDGMEILDLDVSGTYVAAVKMGAPEKHNKPGWRMLLAFIQSPSGNYYVKVLGPAGTVARWEPSFRKYVDSAKPQ